MQISSDAQSIVAAVLAVGIVIADPKNTGLANPKAIIQEWLAMRKQINDIASQEMLR